MTEANICKYKPKQSPSAHMQNNPTNQKTQTKQNI